MSNFIKDGEFQISLSMEDIDKIDEEIKNIENGFKKLLMCQILLKLRIPN